MPAIDALDIWKQLAAECGEAFDYYEGKYPDWPPYERRKQVLNQGAADFDSKCNPNDQNEKDHYRTDYYVSAEGYMDMHLKQNLAVLSDYLLKDIPQPILFVDFGCGPMTAGLALADIMSKQAPNYMMQTAYFGVDASENMVNKANNINREHKFFIPEHFQIVKDTEFNAQKIPDSFPEAQTVLLNLSFVLAPETLKRSDEQPNTVAKTLANDWKKFIANQAQCQKTIIFYINPVEPKKSLKGLNLNWLQIFHPTILSANHAGDFTYEDVVKMQKVRSQSVPYVMLAVIRGAR